MELTPTLVYMQLALFGMGKAARVALEH
jgi:hypothetical protein